MTDIAYNVLSKRKRSVKFAQVWGEIIKKQNLDESTQQKKIAEFYTDLMLDKRFVSLDDNRWDLRSRHAFNEMKIDPLDLDEDDDEFLDDENQEDEE